MFKFIKVSVLSVLMLSGCSTFDISEITGEYIYNVPENPVKLPYNFYMDAVLDVRPQMQEPRLIDHLSERKQHPFIEDLFTQKLIKRMNGKSLYDYEDALVRAELVDYAAFREKFHYTLSFYLDLTAFDEKGKVLATGKFSCVKEKNDAIALYDKVKGVFKHDQDRAAEMEVKQQEVWESLYDACLTDVAREFNNKVRLWGKG